MQVLGVAMLARGVSWAYSGTEPEGPATLVNSLFAMGWALLPALMAGAWATLYWLPRVSAADTGSEPAGHDPNRDGRRADPVSG